MNKKDLASLKKMINNDNGYFTVNKILTAVIHQGEAMCSEVKSWLNYTEPEQDEILEIIKKTLSGKLGKTITEYQFISTPNEPSQAQEMLIEVKNSRFDNDDINENFINAVKDAVQYDGTYSLFSVNFTVSFYNKNTEESEDVVFIATAFCPITLRIDGLVYNEMDNVIEKKTSTDKILEKATDGFLFPTESDHEPDVNHVMYYSKKAASPNISIIENLLGCKYVMSAERQKVNFWGITAKVLEDDMTFDRIVDINERLSDIVASSQAMSEARELDCADMQHIFEKCGVPEEKLDQLGQVYEKIMGSRHATLIASNLCDEKVGIKTGNTTINMDYKKASTHLDVQMLNGRKCLVIPLDSSDVSVLGIDTKV